MKILMFSTHSMKYIWYSPQKSKYPLYRPRTDCSYRSSLIRVHPVCHRGFLNISADQKSRRLVAIIALRVKKLNSKAFLESSVSTCDFSTFYGTLSHNLIKEKLTEMNILLKEMALLYLFCNDNLTFFTSEQL